MKNSIKIAFVAALAVVGIAACTPTENAAPPAPTGSSTPDTPPPSNTVVTETVTSTVTNPPKPDTKPVIDSFGYGKLKLGMTLQQALDAKLIGPEDGPKGDCSLHPILSTNEKVWVSKKLGVASITFSPAMSSDGVGVGATEQKLKAEYTNLKPAGPNYSYVADADGNPAARFTFGVLDGKVTAAFISLKGQDCHN